MRNTFSIFKLQDLEGLIGPLGMDTKIVESTFEWQQGLGRMNGSALPSPPPPTIGHRTLLVEAMDQERVLRSQTLEVLPLTIFVHAKKPGILKLFS